MLQLKAELVARVVYLYVEDQVFYLSEQEARRLRADLNRCIETIVQRRKTKDER